MKTVGIYARVSTLDQHPENQALELVRYAKARGWEIFEDTVFTDHGIGGRKGEDKRPMLRAFMDAARRHKFQVVLIWEYSRIARSSTHLLELMNNFRTWNLDFVSIQQNVDTTTALGRLIYTFLAGLAEYEVEQTRERTLLGLARAKAEGKILGRPSISRRKKKPSVDPEVVRVYAIENVGATLRQIEKIFDIGKSTAGRILKKVRDAVPETPVQIGPLHHRGRG